MNIGATVNGVFINYPGTLCRGLFFPCQFSALQSIRIDTYDNGRPMEKIAKHQKAVKELQISFYFCKPFHSWERGANENKNGLIRQYILKEMDFSEITDEFVSWVEKQTERQTQKATRLSHAK